MVTRRALRLHGWVLAAVVGAVLLLGQAPAVAQTWPAVPFPTADWTVLVYMDGDNDLEQYALMDVNELEMPLDYPDTAKPLVNVVVMLDRIKTGLNPAPSWDVTTDGDFAGAHVFRIKHDTNATAIGSDKPDTGVASTDWGLKDMGDPATLYEFATWGARNYPAKHYALILWDHGGGWRATSTPTKDICYDFTSGNYLSTRGLQAALEMVNSALKAQGLADQIELVAMDACLMGMEEVAYALAPYTDYLVASEELVPGTGLPYDRWLTWLIATEVAGQTKVPPQAAGARDFAKDMVNTYAVSYSGHSQGVAPAQMSAINLGRMSALRQATKDFGESVVQALASDLTGLVAAKVHTWWECAQIYSLADSYIDLGTFASLAGTDPTLPAVQAAASNLLTILQVDVPAGPDKAVTLSKVSTYAGVDLYPDSLYTGLSIYYPMNLMPAEDYQFSPFITSNGRVPELPTANGWWQLISIAPLSVSYAPDPYEDDGDVSTANQMALGGTEEHHWFHYSDDSDVFAFQATEFGVYVLETKNLGPRSDTKLILLGRDEDGWQILATDDNAHGWWGDDSQLIWACPEKASGTYYAVAVQSDSSWLKDYFGGGTFYDLTIDRVQFGDLSIGSRTFWDVQQCYHAGIVTGYAGGYYLPKLPVRRDQMAAFIARALAGGEANVPEASGGASFSDVPADHWASRYVEYAVANGVVKGYQDGLYHPADVVSRGQMAVFVARAMTGGAIPPGPAASDFTDVDGSLWAFDAITYLASQGVVSGFPDDSYRPSSVVTRDQMAAYISRAFLKQ